VSTGSENEYVLASRYLMWHDKGFAYFVLLHKKSSNTIAVNNRTLTWGKAARARINHGGSRKTRGSDRIAMKY